MNRKEYLQSFLKQGQKRLPRKLKKKYSKNFYEGGPILVYTLTQFLNLYKQDEKLVGEAIYRILNTPIEERVFKPDHTKDLLSALDEVKKEHVEKSGVTCELTDISECKLDNAQLKGYLV